MNHTKRPALVLVLAALAAACAPGQNTAGPQGVSAPVPTNLDEMIATALKTSPEVLLAEAKLRQSLAELNQARLKVTREVVGAYSEKKQKQGELTGAEMDFQVTAKSASAGHATGSELEKLKLRVGEAQLGVARADAEIRYLLGVGSQLDPAQIREPAAADKPKKSKMWRGDLHFPEALQTALGRNATATFHEASLNDVVKALSAQANISILIDQQAGIPPDEARYTMTLLTAMPLATVLQALSDQYDLCFVMRDYGILVTNEDRARLMSAPAIPMNLPLAEDAR